jgi:uncharacterized protein (DUF1015 family)
MATIRPFAALRPKPGLALRICELPYDVMSSEEARQIAAGNPLSFLHVSKPEIDLPPAIDAYAEEVYAKGAENFRRLIAQGALRQDPQPCFYLYRQVMGSHSQVGLVAAASCEEYLRGTIKKHELTRPDKEEDRVRHIEALDSQTGPAFLVFTASRALDALVAEHTAGPPAVDFTASDSVRHTAWVVSDVSAVQAFETQFASITSLYIADGHHRSAAAARVFQKRAKPGAPVGRNECAFFLSVIFPHNQVQVLPYNRVLQDLNGHSAQELLQELDAVFTIQPSSSTPAVAGGTPARKHEMALYLAGRWHTLRFRPDLLAATDAIGQLDVTLLQRHVLEPIFGIADPRTSDRINFIGGIRGTAELEKLVNSGEYACAFSMFPTGIDDLMAIADAGQIMPPKSTWFEPKLRDAMFCHML